MPALLTSTLAVVRRSDRPLDMIDDRRLHKAIAAGEWVRLGPGAFATAADWSALTPIEKYRVRVEETVRRLRKPAVISHRSAAAKWGINILGPWPEHTEVTTKPASGGRSGGLIRRHALGIENVARVQWGRHEVTTPAQTALDLARDLPFLKAVTAVDQAIWTGRRGGALTTIDEVRALMDADHPRRGDAQAQRVLAFANPLAANVRESQSRVVIAQLGFPTPRLQERRALRSGRLVFADIYFAEEDHWCEIDGRGKYLSPDFGADRSPDQIVIDEKNRENEIRREVRGFSRWEATEADSPRRIWDILTGDGMPCSRPRP